jgi:hypothetical protein
METSRDRVLKAIERRQPETTPIHLMGPEGIERWLVRFEAKDLMDLRHGSLPHSDMGKGLWGVHFSGGNSPLSNFK